MLGRAGQRAYDRGDIPAAVNMLERATKLAPVTGRPRWLVHLGYALKDAGELERSSVAFAVAAEEADQSGDVGTAARARIGTRWTGAQTGGAKADWTAVARELATLEAVSDDYGLAEGFAVLGIFQSWIGRSEAAAASFERARELAIRTGSRRLGTMALSFQVMLEAWGHLPADEGLRSCDELLEQHRGTAMESFICAARSNYLSLLGNEVDARREVERARAMAREFGYELQAIGAAMAVADQALRARRPEEAEAAARQGFERLQGMGETGFASTMAGLLAQALYAQGRYDDAERWTETVRGLAAPEDFEPQVRWRSVRAKVLARRRAFEEADVLSRDAVGIAAETDWHRFHADALVDRAEILELAGNTDEAVDALRTALELYERKQARVEARHTRRRLEELS